MIKIVHHGSGQTCSILCRSSRPLVFSALKLICKGFVTASRFPSSERTVCPVCTVAADNHLHMLECPEFLRLFEDTTALPFYPARFLFIKPPILNLTCYPQLYVWQHLGKCVIISDIMWRRAVRIFKNCNGFLHLPAAKLYAR